MGGYLKCVNGLGGWCWWLYVGFSDGIQVDNWEGVPLLPSFYMRGEGRHRARRLAAFLAANHRRIFWLFQCVFFCFNFFL